MAKIKPTGQITGIGSKSGGVKNIDISKPITGYGSVANGIGMACDVIGMSEIPIVDQGACVIGAIAYGVAGQPVDALLSLGSIVPGAGKAADAAKIARMANKGVKVAEATAKSAKVAENSTKAAKSAKKTKQLPKQPSKTQAKTPEKKSPQEVQTEDHKLDFYDGEYFGTNSLDTYNPFSSLQPAPKNQGVNYKGYNVNTNSNPPLNNKFKSTGKPQTSGGSTPFGI